MFLFSPLAFSESDIFIVMIDSETFWKEIIRYIIILFLMLLRYRKEAHDIY